MKLFKKLSAFVITTLFTLPNLLAQDEGTYIENLDVQDSSYMQGVLPGAEQASGSNTTVIIIVAVVVIAVLAFILLRKKKK